MGMSLGQFISIRRKRMLMTQEELAKKTNVSKSAIAKWETDGGIPDRDNLYKLANILGVTVNDMHQIIRSMKYKDIDLTVNITPDIIEILDRTHVVVKHDRTLSHSQHICRIPLCRHPQCRQTEEYNNAKFLPNEREE